MAPFLILASKWLHDTGCAFDFYRAVAVFHMPSCTMLISAQIDKNDRLKFDFDVDMIDLLRAETFQLRHFAGLLTKI